MNKKSEYDLIFKDGLYVIAPKRYYDKSKLFYSEFNAKYGADSSTSNDMQGYIFLSDRDSRKICDIVNKAIKRKQKG
jgi:hypothetical protein